VGGAVTEGEPLGGEKDAPAAQQRPGMQTDDDQDEDYSKDSDFSNNNFSEEEI